MKEEQETLPVPPGGDPFGKPTPVRATRPVSTAPSEASETSTVVDSAIKLANKTPASQMLDSFKNRFGRQGTGGGLASLIGGERSGPSTQTPPRNEHAKVTPTSDIGVFYTLCRCEW